MTATKPRPLPQVTDLNAPFFEGLLDDELRLQRCGECDLLRYPIATVCPRCLSKSAAWERVSGRGTVFSTVVFHQVYNQAFADEVPYNVAIVQLAEGPMMMTNVVGVAPTSVSVGDAVRVVFTEVSEGVRIPQFTHGSDA
jgi:uncharacterized OB-fold protein